MKFALNILMTIATLAIANTTIPAANAQPTGRAVHGENGAVGGVRGNNGAAGGIVTPYGAGGATGVQGENGQAGCAAVVAPYRGAGGCKGSYHNEATGANRSGQSGTGYYDGRVQQNRQGSGTRANGSTFNRNLNGNYDPNNGTGNRNATRSGTTQGGDEYNHDKNASYSEGEFCRTVTGEAGEYSYQNNGQLACEAN